MEHHKWTGSWMPKLLRILPAFLWFNLRFFSPQKPVEHFLDFVVFQTWGKDRWGKDRCTQSCIWNFGSNTGVLLVNSFLKTQGVNPCQLLLLSWVIPHPSHDTACSSTLALPNAFSKFRWKRCQRSPHSWRLHPHQFLVKVAVGFLLLGGCHHTTVDEHIVGLLVMPQMFFWAKVVNDIFFVLSCNWILLVEIG